MELSNLEPPTFFISNFFGAEHEICQKCKQFFPTEGTTGRHTSKPKEMACSNVLKTKICLSVITQPADVFFAQV